MRHVGKADKMLELLHLGADPPLAAPPQRTLVFCRGVASARAVQHALAEAGHAVWGFHSQMPEATRCEGLEKFVAAEEGARYLVCTDALARGLDLPRVDHVVNFDFPVTLELYIHRSGRTARAGQPGTVTTLVTPHRAHLAREIERAVEQGDTLHMLQRIPPRAYGLAQTPDWALPKKRRPRVNTAARPGMSRASRKQQKEALAKNREKLLRRKDAAAVGARR